MARKSITDLKTNDKMVADAVEEFKSISEIKYELAMDAYNMQDDETKVVIDRIVATLRQYANGYIQVQLNPPEGAMVPVKIDSTYLGYNLWWLGIEVAKDLAFVGVRVANFEFPPQFCATCGVELIPEKTTAKKAGRG